LQKELREVLKERLLEDSISHSEIFISKTVSAACEMPDVVNIRAILEPEPSVAIESLLFNDLFITYGIPILVFFRN
jgi:hypothetical protein